MFSNMVASLIEHERIETTDAKAKELRRLADRAINWTVSLGDLLTRDEEKLDAADRARKVHAFRMARRVVKQPDELHKLFDEVGPRYIGKEGGYTRVLKVRNRRGDAAAMSIVELVMKGEPEEKKETKAKAGGKKKGEAPAEQPTG
jgi:large subunit ribosomal protein L17